MRLQFVVLLLVICVITARRLKKLPTTVSKYEWTRELEKYGIEVYEWAVVGMDYIIMYSEDDALDKTPISKTRSFHDFSKNLVALKTRDRRIGKVCFISEIARDYETTIKELENRDGHMSVHTESAKNYVSDTRALTRRELFGLSPRLAKFCSGSTAVRVRPESSGQDSNDRKTRSLQREPIRLPDRTLCIWYEWDIKLRLPTSKTSL